MCHIHPIYMIYEYFYWDCTSVQNVRAIGPLFMEILYFKDLGDTSVISECSLGVNLVIDIFLYVVSDTSPLYIWKQSDHYLWRYYILKIWGIRVLFGCERSCSVAIVLYILHHFVLVKSDTWRCLGDTWGQMSTCPDVAWAGWATWQRGRSSWELTERSTWYTIWDVNRRDIDINVYLDE